MNSFLYFRIASYATTSTEEGVYIIGGWNGWIDRSPSRSSTIAKYSDSIWTNTGRLKLARSRHVALTVEGITMIFGGWDGNYGST